MHCSDYFHKHSQGHWLQVNGAGLNRLLVNIGSGNGLEPSGNKPLPEPMLTQIPVAIWRR